MSDGTRTVDRPEPAGGAVMRAAKCCVFGCAEQGGWTVWLRFDTQKAAKSVITDPEPVGPGTVKIAVPICWSHYRALWHGEAVDPLVALSEECVDESDGR